MDLTDLKAQMRTELRTARDAFVERLDSAARLFAFHTPPTPLRELIERAKVVAGYRPVGSEADPDALLLFAVDAGKTIALPHVERRSVPMRFLRWEPGDPLTVGPLGLEQPDLATAPEVTPDLILAPLLGFDRRLHRLGQGAAYYDRAFARFPDAVRVGIAWSAQEVEVAPDDPWDVPLHAVLTEREWIA
jgi:5-formyltetrahydrofolate cyclo-ligase